MPNDHPTRPQPSAVAGLRVTGRGHDIGGLVVRRILPDAQARSVGPFVFFDHMGPADFAPGSGMDVRPHPHIGLATITFLFEGAIGHRDSLGVVEVIRPGDVNLMTAGRGIVHSERTPDAERAAGHRLHGIQTWIALPAEDEEIEPSFHHSAAADLPRIHAPGVEGTVVAGTHAGLRSPALVRSGTLFVALRLQAGARYVLDAEHAERAVYVAAGALRLEGVEAPLATGELWVARDAAPLAFEALEPGLVMLCGGAALTGHRHLWWNFVSTRKDRIVQAAQDWQAGRFDPVPGEHEAIPLPDRPIR